MTTLDCRSRPAPPWLVAVATVLGVFVGVMQCAAGCSLDDPCEDGDSTGMRLPAIILTAALACGPDDQMPSSSTTDDPTGEAVGDAGLEEACTPIVEPNDAWPACREDLICATEFLVEGGLQDAGHCTHQCGATNDCLMGQVCIEGACFFECSDVSCPRDWMSCDDTLVADTAICVGLGTF